MNSTEKKIVYTLIILAIAVQGLIFSSSVRSWIQNKFERDERVVLAKLDGTLRPGSPPIRLIKFLKDHTIGLEAYLMEKTNQGNSEHTLLANLSLPESRDAYLTLNFAATNLGLADVNQDGELEILVPTFDNELVPRLRVYRFNEEFNAFESINEFHL